MSSVQAVAFSIQKEHLFTISSLTLFVPNTGSAASRKLSHPTFTTLNCGRPPATGSITVKTCFNSSARKRNSLWSRWTAQAIAWCSVRVRARGENYHCGLLTSACCIVMSSPVHWRAWLVSDASNKTMPIYSACSLRSRTRSRAHLISWSTSTAYSAFRSSSSLAQCRRTIWAMWVLGNEPKSSWRRLSTSSDRNGHLTQEMVLFMAQKWN